MGQEEAGLQKGPRAGPVTSRLCILGGGYNIYIMELLLQSSTRKTFFQKSQNALFKPAPLAPAESLLRFRR